ncbi:MAG: HAD family hydrolase [Spirochaetota bacterium]
MIKPEQIRVVVLDLDGTLLTSDRQLTPATVAVVEALKEQQILPVIATGRSYQAMSAYQKKLSVTTPVICFNGAAIYDGTTGAELFSQLLDEDIARTIIEEGRRLGLHTQGFSGEQLCYEQESREGEFYQQVTGLVPRLLNFDTLDPLGMTKMMYVSWDRETVTAAAERLEKTFNGRLSHCFSQPMFYEMFSGSVSKERALVQVLTYLGAGFDQVMVLGDGQNDIGMLTEAAVGVAVDNASEDVKAAADEVAPDHDQEGVAVFLDAYFQLGVLTKHES